MLRDNNHVQFSYDILFILYSPLTDDFLCIYSGFV